MLIESILFKIAAGITMLASPTTDKFQYTGQPGYPKAVVFVEAWNKANHTTATYTNIEIPLGYRLNSSNTPAFQNVSFVSLAGSVGYVDLHTVDCVTDKSVHFNATHPLLYSNEPTALKSVLCRKEYLA